MEPITLDTIEGGANLEEPHPHSLINASHGRDCSLIERIIEYVEENYAAEICLRNVAKAFG